MKRTVRGSVSPRGRKDRRRCPRALPRLGPGAGCVPGRDDASSLCNGESSRRNVPAPSVLEREPVIEFVSKPAVTGTDEIVKGVVVAEGPSLCREEALGAPDRSEVGEVDRRGAYVSNASQRRRRTARGNVGRHSHVPCQTSRQRHDHVEERPIALSPAAPKTRSGDHRRHTTLTTRSMREPRSRQARRHSRRYGTVRGRVFRLASRIEPRGLR